MDSSGDADADAFLAEGNSTPDTTAHATGDPDADAFLNAPKESKKESDGALKTAGKVAAHTLSSLGANILGGYQGVRALAQGEGADAAADTVRDYVDKHTYHPEGESTAGKTAQALGSPYNPLNWPGMIAKKGGESAQEHGASPLAATALETGLDALPMVLGMRGPKALEGAAPRIEPTISEPPPGGAAPPMTLAPDAPRPAYSAVAEGEPAAPVTPTFKEPPPVPEGVIELPAAAQASRAKILQDIGLNNVRKSAVTGNPKAGATDFQTSRLDGPAGNMMRSTFDSERGAVGKYAEKLVGQTGGSLGTDQTALYARGNTMVEPLDDLKGYFDKRTSELYKEADAKAGGQPVFLTRMHELVGGDTADFIGTVEGEALLKGVKARMKSLGMIDKEGAPQPATVEQAERLRQYVGDQWSPRTSRLIGRIKDHIDEDVMSNAGGDTYSQARAVRAMRARVLDDPKGIAKIMDSSGPEGINRAVPTERIPDTVTAMPVDQFAHVVKTLRSVPEELQPKAQAAISEIKAHFANRVHEIGSKTQGQWNARGVTQYLSANAARLAQVFTPDELKGFGTLNDAGHVLKVEQSYPGAAVQKHNLLRSGAMAATEHAATAGGAALGGPLGAMAGRAIGSKIAGKIETGSELRAVKNRHVKLSEVLKVPAP